MALGPLGFRGGVETDPEIPVMSWLATAIPVRFFSALVASRRS